MSVVPNQYYNKYVTQQYNFLRLPAKSGGLSYIPQTKSTCTVSFSTQYGTQPCHVTNTQKELMAGPVQAHNLRWLAVQ